MWQLTSLNLPDTAKNSEPVGAPLAILNFGQSAAPLAVIDFDQQLLTETQVISTPTAIVPGQYQITLSNTEAVQRVESGGVSFTPASNPTSPQFGEFVWNPATLSLTIYANSLASSLKITTNSNSDVPTNYVSPNLFAIFRDLPVVGNFSWGCRLHQHPSGSLNLFVLRSEIGLIRSKFKKGNEIEIIGIGFSVANYKEKLLSLKDYPGGCYEINISLGGKWELDKYHRPVYYHDPFFPPSITYANLARLMTAAKILRGIASVTYLASRNGVKFMPKQVAKLADAWNTIIPSDSLNATTDWLKEASERTEEYGYALDFNDPGAVKVLGVDDGRSWNFNVPSIDITCQGDTKNSGSDRFGYAAEYPNVEIDAIFNKSIFFKPEMLEVSRVNRYRFSRINWMQKTPKRVTLESGSSNYAQPPEDVQFIKSVSQAWDASGETKTRRRTVSEDGHPLTEEEWIYGLRFDSSQVVNSEGIIFAPATMYWQICQYKITTYLYHDETGYLLGSDTSGYRWGRFNQESDQGLEAYGLSSSSDSIDARKLQTYKFRQIPLTSKTRYTLKQYRDFYRDVVNVQPPMDFFLFSSKYDSMTIYGEMFAAKEETWSNSFANMPDPDSDPSQPSPDLMTGEITSVEVTRQILPSKSTTSSVDGLQINTKLESDRFIEWRIEDSSQNAGFKDKAVKETFEEHEGRPGPATRRPSALEKEQPEERVALGANISKNYYRLTTPGYDSKIDPVRETLSFNHLGSKAQILEAAKARLKLKDIEESVDFQAVIPFNPQIRPLDKVGFWAGVDYYQTRVVSFQNTVEIQGRVGDFPVITSEGTELNCGIDRDIPVQLNEVPVMAVFGLPVYKDKTLGEPLVRQGKTRGNF